MACPGSAGSCGERDASPGRPRARSGQRARWPMRRRFVPRWERRACWHPRRHRSTRVLARRAGTILLSGPLRAMASFGTPRGHSLPVGPRVDISRATIQMDARVCPAAPRAARVQAAEGARGAGRSAWTRASTVPPPAGDGGAATLPVGPVRSALTGICRDGLADDRVPMMPTRTSARPSPRSSRRSAISSATSTVPTTRSASGSTCWRRAGGWRGYRRTTLRRGARRGRRGWSGSSRATSTIPISSSSPRTPRGRTSRTGSTSRLPGRATSRSSRSTR